MHTSVIIPAAGIGERMGSAIGKQFLSIKGTPIIIHTLRCFQASDAIDEIIIVTREESFAMLETLLAEASLSKVRPLVKGGARRQDSVAHGLAAVAPSTEIVLVHDAVRPFVRASTIAQVADAARHFGAAIAAVRAKDTIKQAGTDGRVAATLDRSLLWNVQTPQGFRTELLREAYARALEENFDATDDSMLVERLGIHPVIVEASYENIKITTPDDLLLGELLAERSMFR
ncbi:MAG: 2-C-methyl-D-erythritol 4-phosphate cytidylyltransferase [Acidobacteriota bacterium]